MKYPATIIQSEYTNIAVFSRPAIEGWEVLCVTQIADKHNDGTAERMICKRTVRRQREIAKAIQEAVEIGIESINKAMAKWGDVGEWEIKIGQGIIDDCEILH